jgi:hypothetical protein
MIGVAAVSAQKGANFAGTWELDKAKSALPQREIDGLKSTMWTVTQDDKQLTRAHMVERVEGAPGGEARIPPGISMESPLIVKLDGSETTTEAQRGKSTSKVKWLNGSKTLEVIIVGDLSGPSGGFSLTTTEHWELADGGKTLKIHRKMESRLGDEEATWVLTRK